MLNRFAFVPLALILCASLLIAHGDPIMGTVTAVTNDSFTIKDKTDKPVTIMLEKSTKFVRADKTVNKEELKPGVRVIIDAHMDTKMKMYAAEEVVIGTAPARK